MTGAITNVQTFTLIRPAPASAQAERGLEIGHALAELNIDAAGKLASCTVVEQSGRPPAGEDEMCKSVSRLWQPRPGPDGKPAPFRAFYAVAGYAEMTPANVNAPKR